MPLPQLYLASRSRARRELLRKLGLRVKVIPSRVEEIHRRQKGSFAGLVKHNALAKARDVACRLKKGVVIAADTIVVQDNKIFGKPKNLQDARRMLKRLSRKPQWLYTGVAVIEVSRNKTLVGHEKTKVIMDPLSHRQITRYFRRVTPLDKAGSFDIQGQGAFFIRRIEGCFYNVVGMPLRTLRRMLDKLT